MSNIINQIAEAVAGQLSSLDDATATAKADQLTQMGTDFTTAKAVVVEEHKEVRDAYDAFETTLTGDAATAGTIEGEKKAANDELVAVLGVSEENINTIKGLAFIAGAEEDRLEDLLDARYHAATASFDAYVTGSVGLYSEFVTALG